MKKSRWMLVGMGVYMLTACGLLNSASHQEAVEKICEGMSVQQVSDLLGRPDFKRFDSGVEQWEYRDYYYWMTSPVVVTIDFLDGKVVALNTFSDELHNPHPPVAVCPPAGGGVSGELRPVPPAVAEAQRNFERIYRLVEREAFVERKIKVLEKEVGRTKFSCAECVRLLNLCSFDEEKLKLLRVLAPVLTDRQNGEVIIDCMTFISGESEARKILEGYQAEPLSHH